MDNDTNIDTTYHPFLNRSVLIPSTEELNGRRNNEPANEHISRILSASWQGSIGEPIAPSRDKAEYESSLNNMRYAMGGFGTPNTKR